MNSFLSIILNANILTWQAILDIILMTAIIFFCSEPNTILFFSNSGVQMLASILLAAVFWLTLVVAQGEIIEKVVSVFCKIIASPSVQPVDKRWPDVDVNIIVVKQAP